MAENNKKALIIGAAGFVGDYLIDELYRNDYAVHATMLTNERIGNSRCVSHVLDILDDQGVNQLLDAIRPDVIVLLAAQSSVALSWQIPKLTFEINTVGPVNVLEAIRKLAIQCRILLVGSSEEYGVIRPEEIPITESRPVEPQNPYAISKVAQELFGELYVNAYGLDIVFVRSFNHIGPKQLPVFVVADFAKQVALIEKEKQPPVIEVGNLEARRDFTDVRDIVKAYIALLEKGKSGEIYNVGSGKSVKIAEVLDFLIQQARLKIVVRQDDSKLRPVDVPVIESDTRKINQATGWKPAISLGQSLIDILDYWREVS